jgi:lysyl-tRNA synthetase class 1
MTIPDLFDEFDRCANIFWQDSNADLARAFHFSQVNNWYKKALYMPRFRDVANVIQLKTKDPIERFEKEKGSKLSDSEKEILEQRLNYATIWIERFAPEDVRFSVAERLPTMARNLSKEQREFLADVAQIVEKETDSEKLQTEIYETGKQHGLPGTKAFQAIYISLIGKTSGPKAAWFISSLDRKFVVKRLRQAAEYVK